MAKYTEDPINQDQKRVRIGFDWPVFFMGPLWYFLNGAVIKGLAWLIVAILCGIFTFGFGTTLVVWLLAGINVNIERIKNPPLQQGRKFTEYENETNHQVTSPEQDTK